MVDPTDIELCAMDAAGAFGGAYLDEIKKTDLATLTTDEWKTFIQTVCGAYVDELTHKQDEINRAINKTCNIPG